ncbi:MAG: phytoene/squalene synthase family protein [Kineosporiaceae bacterium]
MSARALDATGIRDPQLRSAFETCRRLYTRHARVSYLTSQLLPLNKRPYVWALHGFARRAEDFAATLPVADPQKVATWAETFLDGGGPDEVRAGPTTEPVALALTHTLYRWGIPRAHVEAFTDSLRMDMVTSRYPAYVDLERYAYGAASVVGLQLLPILEPLAPEAGARLRALGEAFLLTDIIRGLGEDLRRDRIYLPMEDLAAFGVTEQALRAGAVTAPIREMLRFEVERTRRLITFGRPGIDMVHPTSRECLNTSVALREAALVAVEESHFQVLDRRVEVPVNRRMGLVLPALRRARAVRRAEERWVPVPREQSPARA